MSKSTAFAGRPLHDNQFDVAISMVEFDDDDEGCKTPPELAHDGDAAATAAAHAIRIGGADQVKRVNEADARTQMRQLAPGATAAAAVGAARASAQTKKREVNSSEDDEAFDPTATGASRVPELGPAPPCAPDGTPALVRNNVCDAQEGIDADMDTPPDRALLVSPHDVRMRPIRIDDVPAESRRLLSGPHVAAIQSTLHLKKIKGGVFRDPDAVEENLRLDELPRPRAFRRDPAKWSSADFIDRGHGQNAHPRPQQEDRGAAAAAAAAAAAQSDAATASPLRLEIDNAVQDLLDGNRAFDVGAPPTNSKTANEHEQNFPELQTAHQLELEYQLAPLGDDVRALFAEFCPSRATAHKPAYPEELSRKMMSLPRQWLLTLFGDGLLSLAAGDDAVPDFCWPDRPDAQRDGKRGADHPSESYEREKRAKEAAEKRANSAFLEVSSAYQKPPNILGLTHVRVDAVPGAAAYIREKLGISTVFPWSLDFDSPKLRSNVETAVSALSFPDKLATDSAEVVNFVTAALGPTASAPAAADSDSEALQSPPFISDAVQALLNEFGSTQQQFDPYTLVGSYKTSRGEFDSTAVMNAGGGLHVDVMQMFHPRFHPFMPEYMPATGDQDDDVPNGIWPPRPDGKPDDIGLKYLRVDAVNPRDALAVLSEETRSAHLEGYAKAAAASAASVAEHLQPTTQNAAREARDDDDDDDDDSDDGFSNDDSDE